MSAEYTGEINELKAHIETMQMSFDGNKTDTSCANPFK